MNKQHPSHPCRAKWSKELQVIAHCHLPLCVWGKKGSAAVMYSNFLLCGGVLIQLGLKKGITKHTHIFENRTSQHLFGPTVLQTGFNLLVSFLGYQISKFGGPGQFLVAQQISSIFTPIYVGNVLFSSYQVMNIKRSF